MFPFITIWIESRLMRQILSCPSQSEDRQPRIQAQTSIHLKLFLAIILPRKVSYSLKGIEYTDTVKAVNE